MDNQNFINNRKSVFKTLEQNSLTVLFAGKAPNKLGDMFYEFTPNRNFYYLTGLSSQKLIFLAFKEEDTYEEYIFIERYDEIKQKWEGNLPLKEEIQTFSGINNIKYLDEFHEVIGRLIFKNDINKIYFDLENRYLKLNEEVQNTLKTIKSNYPHISILNIYSKIAKFRLIKTEEEVLNIKKAINITRKGIESLIKNAKPNMFEYELEAYFDFELKRNGVFQNAFKSIIASSKNAATLHYQNNNSKIEEGSLVLIDVGATYGYYSADISRTFPISGKFSQRQKQLYNIVLAGQKKAINLIKPNVSIKELNQSLISHYEQELTKIGLIKDKSEVSKYYYHNIGHFLGLETHDVSSGNLVLQEGMVLTIEPGLYIPEENIGIRIEDDILVNKNGSENLSFNILKTVEEIEEFMS